MTRRLPKLTVLFALLAVLMAASACAYRYAGEEAPDKHYAEKRDDARVVEIKNDEGDERVKTSSEQKAKSPESPCGVETFEVRRYGPETQLIRTIDCRTREVLKVERKPIGQQSLTTLRERGHPEDTWYMLVDPEGLRSNYVNNVELMKIRERFELSFEGKDRREELMIYVVDEPLD